VTYSIICIVSFVTEPVQRLEGLITLRDLVRLVPETVTRAEGIIKKLVDTQIVQVVTETIQRLENIGGFLIKPIDSVVQRVEGINFAFGRNVIVNETVRRLGGTTIFHISGEAAAIGIEAHNTDYRVGHRVTLGIDKPIKGITVSLRRDAAGIGTVVGKVWSDATPGGNTETTLATSLETLDIATDLTTTKGSI